MEENRRHMATPKVRPSIHRLLATLRQLLADLDRELDDFIRQSPLWQGDAELVQIVPGIGPVIAYGLIAFLPELSTLPRRPLAALAGVAPFNQDSGKHRGKRKIHGGRGKIRHLLYMTALSACRWNQVFRSFYQRLLDAGKPQKVALTAWVRKRLTILHAMLKRRMAWSPPAYFPLSRPQEAGSWSQSAAGKP